MRTKFSARRMRWGLQIVHSHKKNLYEVSIGVRVRTLLDWDVVVASRDKTMYSARAEALHRHPIDGTIPPRSAIHKIPIN